MILKAERLGLEMGGKAVAIMNSQDAERLGILGHARITIRAGKTEHTAIIRTSPDLIHPGHIGIVKIAWIDLGLTEGMDVEVEAAPFPASSLYKKQIERKKARLG